MPKYTYHLEGGKTLSLEGDTPPTDDEVESIAKQQGVKLQLADSAAPTSTAPVKTIQTTDTQPAASPQEKPQSGWLSKAWHYASDPLINLPSRAASAIGETFEHPTAETSPLMARVRGFGAGAIQGIGDLVSGLTSPLNLATTAASMGEGPAIKAGYDTLASGLKGVSKIGGAMMAGHGATKVFDPSTSLSEKAFGAAEMAGGGAAVFHTPDVSSAPKAVAEEGPHPANKEIFGNEKPRYKMDMDSGTFIPVDKDGKQIGPAQMPGKELMPEATKASKYTKASDDKTSTLQQVYDLPRGLMSVDPPFVTSAAFRQASPMIGTKAWFNAWVPAAKSFGSQETFDALQRGIADRPLFKSTMIGDTEVPSYAQQTGLKIADLGSWTKREEALRGELAEKLPVYGKYVKASNRAYTAFLNSVRADTFENIINAADKDGLNPKGDLSLGKNIAEFVNTATGRGSLGVEIGNQKIDMERYSKLLANTLFSPRKIASEVRMLNPSTYMFSPPIVRQQYIAAMARRVGTWWTIAGLAQLAGAQVSKNPTSADFGKIKIGNTRIDPPGGLQQYLVLGTRLMPAPVGGGTTSTTTGQFSPFGKGYKPETRASQLEQFGINRAHPTAKFAYDLFNATQKAPFHVGDKIAQSILPMYMGDALQVARDNKDLASSIIEGGTAALTSGMGIGTQSYERGSFGKPTFIPQNFDWNIGR